MTKTAPAGKTSASRPRWSWPLTALVAALAVALLAGGVVWWVRAKERARAVASSIPVRPDLRYAHPQLVERISAAEQGASRGEVASLAELQGLYQINGFLYEADAAGQSLMRLEPGNGVWPHRLATIRAGFGELETALLLWERTVRLAPEHLPARIRLGDAYLKSNRDAEAATAYQEVLQREENNPYALVGLARLDLKAGRATSARDKLEQASGSSNGAIGTDLLVTVYEQLGDHGRAAALRARTKSAGTYFDPPDPWLDVLYDDCFDVFRLTVAAGFAGHGGDPATGRRILERAAELEPTNGHVFLQLGMLCRGTRDYADAQRFLERAAEVNPRLSDAWAQLIELHKTLGNTTAAARALAAGLTHCPGSPGLHLERARRLRASGQIDAAIAEYRETFRLRPEEPDPLIEIAQIYFKQERSAEAVAELERALLSEPEHPLTLMTLAVYAISVGDQRAADDWVRRCHLQYRIPRDGLAEINARYAARFGRPFVMPADPPLLPR